MDAISLLNTETDSSISLIKEGIKKGIEIWIAEPGLLTLVDNDAFIVAKKIINDRLEIGDEKEFPLEYFDFYFIRQDPPFDLNYVSNCYLLEIHKKFHKKPLFINDPSGIKDFTEKIFPLYFKKFMPSTMITGNFTSFKSMLLKFKKVILKPLYFKGGEGILKVDENDNFCKEEFDKLVSSFQSPLVVQEFLQNVRFGDKRVILIDGEPVGAINRVPKEGNYKANLHLGGIAEKTKLSTKENLICSHLKPVLKKNLLFFVGIDIIDEKLTEINVTSPTGISQINNLYNINLSQSIWDKLL